jgi:signal transduction histidine kinase
MPAGLVTGLIIGWATSLLVGVALAAYAWHRFVLLDRRTRQAERLAELGTLTGGLAHEIKNPLSTVQLNLQLLREDLLPENPSYSRLVSRLSTVQQETGRLREILDDFLRFAGRIELDRKPTELNSLLDELVDFFGPQAQAHRVQLRLKRAPEPIVASVDGKLIKQAVLNLMLNGVQAMGERGGDLILGASADEDEACIDVIDTGPGITPENVEKIFNAYYTTRKGGTGLGLAMTKRIAEEHGGSVSVTSAPGMGSDFTIRVPLK